MSALSVQRFWPLVVLGVAVGISVTAAAAPPGLTSTWRTQPIAIDGMTAEWPKAETLPRGPDVSVANDEEFLYIAVSTSDDGIRSLLETGLIVWIDTAGGKAQTFGIWAPGMVLRALPGASPAPPPDSSATGISTKTLDHFDLLGPGKNQRRLVDLTPNMGIQLASGTEEKKVVYEVRLPLAKTADRAIAVGVSPGKTVGLGIATPESPRDRGDRRGPLVGSTGTIGGSPYRGGGFAQTRERPEGLKPLDVWTTVKLATK
jgi:hypothetical protein